MPEEMADEKKGKMKIKIKMRRNQVEAGKPWPFELLQAMVQLYYP